MQDPATTIADELHRLTALYSSGLLEDGPQAALDGLVALAAGLLGCPLAMLTLVDRDVVRRHTTNIGPLPPLSRRVVMCDNTIAHAEGLVIEDLAADPRYATGPLVAEGVRFYAGAPVHALDATGTKRRIGSLCVVDTSPRRFDEGASAMLRQLAAMADMLIAARADAQYALAIAAEHERLVGDLARQHRVFAQAERMAQIGSWRLSLPDERLEWSEGVYRIYGLPPGSPPALQDALDPYPPEARRRVAAVLASAVMQCTSFDFEEDFRPAAGELRRVRCIGECEQADGANVALVGVFQDVTDRHRLETALRRDADTDALTGLANRAAFDRGLETAVQRARADASPLLLALIDLDGFKAVNDTLGHAAGDDVLRKVGAALRTLPFAATMVARIGGDEFALLVDDPAVVADPALHDRIEQALLVSGHTDGLTLACSGSVGLAWLDDTETMRDFFHRADVALYAAKRARIGERRRTERRRAA